MDNDALFGFGVCAGMILSIVLYMFCGWLVPSSGGEIGVLYEQKACERQGGVFSLDRVSTDDYYRVRCIKTIEL